MAKQPFISPPLDIPMCRYSRPNLPRRERYYVNLRITAPIITFFALPRAASFSANARIAGHHSWLYSF